jgi:hypothetical protein
LTGGERRVQVASWAGKTENKTCYLGGIGGKKGPGVLYLLKVRY